MIFRIINPFVIGILQSRFHFLLSKNLLVLCFRGRVTNREIVLPVSYLSSESGLFCVTARKNVWWTNLKYQNEIKIWFRGQEKKAVVTVDSKNISEVRSILGSMCRHSVIDSFFAGVKRKKHGELDQVTFEKAVPKHVALVVNLIHK